MLLQPPNANVKTFEYDFIIDGVKLMRVHDCKFLGIFIDESLSWKRHIAHLNQKISIALFSIKQLKLTLPTETLRTLYFSLIHPHLMFGILAWGNAKMSLLRKTEVIQKRAICTILKKKSFSHTDSY